ncbi:hypothetical protein [Paraliomyxa miuraensis]|uniref:hypothetical protein n=1 Tax=Paraliomyxa miuraensis TaxID=376150 RepID=UPI002251A9FD|nr:hypothetical protein [Paraliomyxa miuraensis]MCX4239218.1 hypothetical protein [Paraliomyxa miuraensis]
MRAAAISFVSVMLLAGTANAQPEGDADAAAFAGEDGGVAVYDFEDDNVDGEVLRPEGANLSSRGSLKHASLINIRPHFLRELINLARDV